MDSSVSDKDLVISAMSSKLRILEERLEGANKAISTYPKYSSKRDETERRIGRLITDIAEIRHQIEEARGQSFLFEEVD